MCLPTPAFPLSKYGRRKLLAPYRAGRLYARGRQPGCQAITPCGTGPPPAGCGGEPGSFRAATHWWFVVVSCLTGAMSSSLNDPRASSSERPAAIAVVSGLRGQRLWSAGFEHAVRCRPSPATKAAWRTNPRLPLPTRRTRVLSRMVRPIWRRSRCRCVRSREDLGTCPHGRRRLQGLLLSARGRGLPRVRAGTGVRPRTRVRGRAHRRGGTQIAPASVRQHGDQPARSPRRPCSTATASRCRTRRPPWSAKSSSASTAASR
jgi:hypothetical protein